MNGLNYITNEQIIEALRCGHAIGGAELCSDCNNTPFCYASVREANSLIANRIERLMMQCNAYNNYDNDDDDDGWRDK